MLFCTNKHRENCKLSNQYSVSMINGRSKSHKKGKGPPTLTLRWYVCDMNARRQIVPETWSTSTVLDHF